MKQLDFSVLKTLRQKRKMTAEQLASEANVTRATIAKIEAGFDNPRVQTIEALASVFQLSAGDLIRLAEGGRIEEARTEPYSQEGCSGTRFFFRNQEMYLLKAVKGSKTIFEHNLHEDTMEICIVLSGQLTVQVGEQSLHLASGSAATFHAMHEHSFSIGEDANFLLIHTRNV
ncbi:helix-turn-helix domain-containing protein [Prosthecochloris sp.]|uniref:helix-turn-helix domain-containing protein n=1 Tax=Prosthecochloris sp. TaxID=290513 RepID=UPI00257A9CF9|nr:helix-turn-helix domain-containing protein [Prosthecochloris sp.]